jgi:hypothetical protein
MITKYSKFISEKINDKDYRIIGNKYWYEYHCLECHTSQDAELWYHSHQQVIINRLVEPGVGDTKYERLVEYGVPAIYNVTFNDGYTYDVFEDEILDSPDEYTRPDPPSSKL